MADESSLDDFFAKKDKSKKKSKSKIKPDDILSLATEKPKKKKKPKATETDVTDDSKETKKKEGEEEWAEVVEEEETDYTGLRIQTLQASGEKEEENEGEDGEGGEDGDRERKDEASGPWNKAQGDERPTAPPPPPKCQPAPEPVPDATAGKVQSGKYIPPGRRNNPDGASVVVTSSARRKPKVAPNLQSECDFPTLGGASERDSPGMLQFEEVRSGGRQVQDTSHKTINLQLDNKFGALQTD